MSRPSPPRVPVGFVPTNLLGARRPFVNLLPNRVLFLLDSFARLWLSHTSDFAFLALPSLALIPRFRRGDDNPSPVWVVYRENLGVRSSDEIKAHGARYRDLVTKSHTPYHWKRALVPVSLPPSPSFFRVIPIHPETTLQPSIRLSIKFHSLRSNASVIVGALV